MNLVQAAELLAAKNIEKDEIEKDIQKLEVNSFSYSINKSYKPLILNRICSFLELVVN